MAKNELSEIRETAEKSLINWAKTGYGYYSMRDAVNSYLEACGANRPTLGGDESILARRRIATNRLAIDCIYALSKDELSKLDRELELVANNIPKQGGGHKR